MNFCAIMLSRRKENNSARRETQSMSISPETGQQELENSLRCLVVEASGCNSRAIGHVLGNTIQLRELSVSARASSWAYFLNGR